MVKVDTKHDVFSVLNQLEMLIDAGRTVKIDDVYDDLSIFDWWKDDLSISNMKDMRKFLKEAVRMGFTGYCCFKVGVTGCANGMWANRENSTDGYSPKDSPCLYKAFTCAYDYWSIDLKGDDNWLPARNEYDCCKTVTDLKDYVVKHVVQTA